MSARTELVERLGALVGVALEIEDLATGWPSLATLRVDDEEVPLALFVSPVGRSHRQRDAVERRFQNPSNVALAGVDGRESILLGLWESDDLLEVDFPVVIMAEAHRRDDGRTTRWSVFLFVDALLRARDTGWSKDVTDSGETIYYLHPALLPVAIMASLVDAEPSESAIHGAALGLGLLDPEVEPLGLPDAERARRTVNSLVRNSKFSGSVLAAYGKKCSMCGIGIGLVQGAHIYPASAQGSRDEVANGLALCANHHLAFDRHVIAVHPETLQVRFHPSILEIASSDEIVAAFVMNTADSLRVPPGSAVPQASAFRERYAHYGEKYAWLLESWR